MYVEIHVRLGFSRDDEFDVRLINRGDGFIVRDVRQPALHRPLGVYDEIEFVVAHVISSKR